MIKWEDFEKIDLRVGTIIKCERFLEAKKPAFKLLIDFGDGIGLKKSSAQITHLYAPEDLVDRQIVAIINFPPKQIGSFISECLVLGIYGQDGVILLSPERKAANGAKIG